MDRKTLQEAVRLSNRHEPYVLAQVVGRKGSAPRRVGGAMIRRRDGSFFGSVGGARLEEEVKSLMAETSADHRSTLKHFELKSWRRDGLESQCGGAVDVAIEYVAPSPHVLIWGGGHVGKALSRVLDVLGTDYTVADDRPEYVTESLFPHAHHLWLGSPREVSTRVKNEEAFSHVYALGYDGKKDEELIALLLPWFPGHIGLIASKTKRGLMLRALRGRGLSQELVARVRSPVGLPIRAESPEEIAVSITAEIIQDCRSGVE